MRQDTRDNNKVIVRLWRRKLGDRIGYRGHLAIEIPSLNFYRSCMPSAYRLEEKSNSHSSIVESYREDIARLGDRPTDEVVEFNHLRIDDIVQQEVKTRNNVSHQSFVFRQPIFASEDRDESTISGNYNCVQYVEMLLVAGGLSQLRPFHVGQVSLIRLFIFFLLGTLIMDIKTDPTLIIGALIVVLSNVMISFYCCRATYRTLCGYGGIPLPEPYFDKVFKPASMRDLKRNSIVKAKKRHLVGGKLTALTLLLTGITYIVLGATDSEGLFIGKTASIVIGAVLTFFGCCCLNVCSSVDNNREIINAREAKHRYYGSNQDNSLFLFSPDSAGDFTEDHKIVFQADNNSA